MLVKTSLVTVCLAIQNSVVVKIVSFQLVRVVSLLWWPVVLAMENVEESNTKAAKGRSECVGIQVVIPKVSAS